MRFRIRGCHPLRPAFPSRSANAALTSFRRSKRSGDRGPTTPGSPCGSPGLGCSDFARHYFRNRGCFLFLWVLRWFTSPGSPPAPMDSERDSPCSHGLGSPIRRSPDHSLLAAPRGLSQLATSFLAYLRQGIHTHALSSLTIKFTPDTEMEYGGSTATCGCPSVFSFQRSPSLRHRAFSDQLPALSFRLPRADC